ncbi:hypothetical protein [Kitasatospora sp. NPDC002965]|uniref:hypothetical protein n=1 Tax=Kitasatospora sp. NPDC002965 TaxID=3154775 RepID=UPI0033A6CFF1
MSIIPQAGSPGHTDPTITSSAVAPVLSFRTPPAPSRTAAILAAGPSAKDVAEDRFADIVDLLALAAGLGVVGTLHLGTVSPAGFEAIACALESEDVGNFDDTSTITLTTDRGHLVVAVQVDGDGQVAA